MERKLEHPYFPIFNKLKLGLRNFNDLECRGKCTKKTPEFSGSHQACWVGTKNWFELGASQRSKADSWRCRDGNWGGTFSVRWDRSAAKSNFSGSGNCGKNIRLHGASLPQQVWWAGMVTIKFWSELPNSKENLNKVSFVSLLMTSLRPSVRVRSKSPSLARAVEEVMSKETDETWFKSFLES